MTKAGTRVPIAAVTVAAAVLGAGALVAPVATAAVTAPIDCPDALPTSQAVDGLTGTGFTVERGKTPEAFQATLLGRVTDGIGPGVDMILADLSSPALTRAGGVWGGMSGSPVYAADGRLIGAVAYGLAGSSPIAGITPAEEMAELLGSDAAATGQEAKQSGKQAAKRRAAALPDRVAVGAATARRLARTGDVSAAAAAGGFTRLKVPLSVSGALPGHRAAQVERLRKAMPGTIVHAGAAAPRTAAAPDEIHAGSNFAAAVSYGTATLGAVGTTTFVCDGEAVAFGHPFTFTGADARFSAHAASAVMVQPDAVFGPFKVANIEGVAGVVDADRLAGLHAEVGDGPRTAPVTTNFAVDGAPARTMRTTAVAQPFLADITFSHLLAAVDSGLDKIGPGSATVTFRVTGVRADGSPFSVSRDDRVSDTSDIAGALALRAADFVFSLTSQAFEDIRITGVTMGGELSSKPSEYRLTAVQVRSQGRFVTIPSQINVKEGGVLTTRLTLRPYRGQGTTKRVVMEIPVPRGSGEGVGVLTVSAGEGFAEAEPETFPALLAQLRTTPGPDSLRLAMTVENAETGRTVRSQTAERADRAVSPYENTYDVVSTS
jgi:hypothetical protein